jgi:hypothetical protein
VARRKGFELVEDAVQRFLRERQRHTNIFEWEKEFCKSLKKFKFLRINNGFYEKTIVVYGESATFFLVKIIVEEINNNDFYKITVVDSSWKIK